MNLGQQNNYLKENEMFELTNRPSNIALGVSGISNHDSSKLDLINNANSSNKTPDSLWKLSKIKQDLN